MRLPEFIMNLPPVKWVLQAIEFVVELFRKAVMRKNDQLAVSTAEEGLSNWERDYSLPSEGDTEARRSRIRAAMAGGQTLTRQQMASLAVTVAGADAGDVEEIFADWLVRLYALYDGEVPETLPALEEALKRLRTSHLTMEAEPARRLRHETQRQLGLSGTAYFELRSEEGGETT